MHRAGLTFCALWLVVIGLATLIPAGPNPSVVGLCLACGEYGTADFVLNVLLFVPLGIGLALTGVPFQRAFAIIAATTIAIELAQLVAIAGRDASAGDVIANSLGGALGHVLGTNRQRLAQPTKALATSLFGATLAGWIVLQSVSGFSMLPAPTTSQYYGQYVRPLGDEAHYPGRILRASLGGRSFPDWELADWPRHRAALASDSGATLDLVFEGGGGSARFAPVVRILDREHREQLSLGAVGPHTVFAVRTRASDLRLRPLAFVLRDALPRRSGTSSYERLHATARYGRPEVRMLAGSIRSTASSITELRTSRGWRLFAPLTVYVDGSIGGAALDALWLSAALLLAGYWCRFGMAPEARGRNSVLASVLLLAVAGGTYVVPRVFHLHAASRLEVAACGAMLINGWLRASSILRGTVLPRQEGKVAE